MTFSNAANHAAALRDPHKFSPVPLLVQQLPEACRLIAAGGMSSAAVLASGGVYHWGIIGAGQQSEASRASDTDRPVQVFGALTPTAVPGRRQVEKLWGSPRGNFFALCSAPPLAAEEDVGPPLGEEYE